MRFASPMTYVLFLGAFSLAACDQYTVPARDHHAIVPVGSSGASWPGSGENGSGSGDGASNNGGGSGGSGSGGSGSDGGGSGGSGSGGSDPQNCSPGKSGKKTNGYLYPVPEHSKGKPASSSTNC